MTPDEAQRHSRLYADDPTPAQLAELEELADEPAWRARRSASGQIALLDGCTTDVSLSQWFTPPTIALQMAELLAAGMTTPEHAMILEPAAGSGSLVAAARLVMPECSITAHELDPSWAKHLRAFGGRIEVVQGDYLTAPAPCGEHAWYGGALLNTPFEDGADAAFLSKAMDESHTVVALLRLVALTGVARHKEVWSRVEPTPGRPPDLVKRVRSGPWALEELRLFKRRPKFGEGKGAKSDFCVIRLRLNGRDSTNVGWW